MVLTDKSISIIDDLKYMCSNIFGMLRVPITFLNKEGELILQFPEVFISNPLYLDYSTLYEQFLNSIEETTTIFTNSTKFLENYAFVIVRDKNKFLGTIIIGPCLFSSVNSEFIDELIKNLDIQVKYKNDLLHYYQHMSVISYDALVNACSIFHYFIYRKQLSIITLTENLDIYEKTFSNINHSISSAKISQDFENYMLENIKNGFSHHSPKYEAELLGHIKEGNLDNLIEFLEKKPADKYSRISKNPLRNQKNLFISFVSLVSHAAIDGGLDWELALSLSDYYIHIVEEENSIKDILNLYSKMFIDFTERVRSANSTNSAPIIKCKNYIFEHLFDKFSLSDIAEATGMNSNYLSYLFKKKVGVTIGDYIQSERIEVAKKMLISSDESLSEIYVSLGFIDQSHFTKIFKKFTGMTPKAYRLSHKHR